LGLNCCLLLNLWIYVNKSYLVYVILCIHIFYEYMFINEGVLSYELICLRFLDRICIFLLYSILDSVRCKNKIERARYYGINKYYGRYHLVLRNTKFVFRNLLLLLLNLFKYTRQFYFEQYDKTQRSIILLLLLYLFWITAQ